MRTGVLLGLISVGLTSFGIADDPDVASPLASYQLSDTLGETPEYPNVVSPVVSYQYYDWPGDANLTFQNSPLVSYQFEGPPTILQQPQSQIAKVGTNIAFTVTADGSTPLGYQWRLSGTNLNGEIVARLSITNVQLSNAGDYSVVVWNNYGVLTSSVCRLHVYVPPPTPQPVPPTVTPSIQPPPINLTAPPRAPSSTQLKVFTGNGLVDRNKMTIVLTHGWKSASDGWPTALKNALVAKGCNANIVAWDWSDNADTVFPSTSAARTASEGEALGSELLYVLGATYDQPIHFIGHSLGTMVNCRAADFIHGDAKNSPGKQPGSTLKYNPQNTHMTLFDEAELVVPVNGIHLAIDVLFKPLGDTTADLINNSWLKVIPDRSAWVDNYLSEVGSIHADAVNVLLWRNATLGFEQSHSYATRWYSASIANPLSSLIGHRWSFERNTISAAPARGTYFMQENDADPMTLRVLQVGTITASAVAYPTFKAYRGLYSLGSTVMGGYTAMIQYAGNLVADFAETFTPLTGDPVFLGTANSTPAYYLPSGSPPMYQAGWDLQFSLQSPTTPQAPQQVQGVHLLENETPTNSVYVWIPVTVPLEAVAMTFQFRLDGAGAVEYLTMGISNVNYFTMEAKYVDDGVWQTTSAFEIPQYAGQDVQLLFSLNSESMPSGTLSVRGIQFYSPPRPDLMMATSSNQPVLSWPVSAIGWQLELTESLTETNWTALTNLPAVQDYQRTITDDGSAGQRLYRLRK